MAENGPIAHIDYTEMAHHEEIPEARDTYDPSRPQGLFWYQNERPGAAAIERVKLPDLEHGLREADSDESKDGLRTED